MRRRLFKLLLSLTLLGLPLAPAPRAMAQSYQLPKVDPPAERSVAKEWLIGSVFLVGCLVVAFKPAKRANLQ